MKKIKVAISQRIIPHYRIPVFVELASRKDIDLMVFFGQGLKTGSQVNATQITGFRAKKLFTIFLNYKGVYGSSQLRVWHPSLMFHLIFESYDVVIVEPSTNFYNDIFIYLYCKLFRRKFIWYESGSVPKEQRPKFRRMIDPILSLFIKGSDSFITYTSYADESLIRDFDINKKMIFRAQNTVDISGIDNEIIKYNPFITEKKEELGLSGYKVSMYIGGIENRKKINNLITATTNLNNAGIPAKTLIVGDGPDKELLISQMSAKEREHTVFAGKHIKDATLYILLSDVVVLPSAGGLSVIQAFACGKPFIGSVEIEHGGINDYVTDGVNGFLIKENDINDLQNVLGKIFSDEDLYNVLCKNAYVKSKELTIIKMVDGIENSIKFSIQNK
jgi:glycosyltransferase involved in cell wall biosynthesis